MKSYVPPMKLDRTALTITDPDEAMRLDREYWLSLEPMERLAALEQMRRMAYGTAATTARLQRILEIVERP